MSELPNHQASRLSAEALLQAFIPKMGADYERQRNFDFGPGKHHAVSRLSPYLRRRLILESEVVQAALDAHGPKAAEKFIQEVLWRTYFKGWLELRPLVWTKYREGLDHDLLAIESNAKLRARIEAAEEGRTGLECFDAWAHELIETGYLHNHARMWFASIWIFTLKLPWRIGADFFYRHLLDGDAASNTLSWRWVAGLHTRGKAYAAEAWNIEKFTAGRFQPEERELKADIEPLDNTEPEGLPTAQRLREFAVPNPALPSLLLLTDEDCRVEDFNLPSFTWVAAASLVCSGCRSPRTVSDHVINFEREALTDVAYRIQQSPVVFTVSSGNDALADLAELVLQSGAKQIITPYLTQGPTADLLQGVQKTLEARGVRLCEWRREWDAMVWPHASAGFFKVKQKIPDFLRQLGSLKV
jgi:deoxyribodipyrimidine photo-lyase